MSRFFLTGPLILLSMLVTVPALACRGGENTPTDSLESAFKSASTVFIGEVVSVVENDKKDVLATFKILKSWKGLKSGTLSIPVQTGRSCDLGRYVESGSKWFILLSGGSFVATKSHSRRLFEAKEEEQIVNEIEKLRAPQ